MDNRRNYYRVLRVQPEAPSALIKRVYRVLMQQLKLHPDLGGDTGNAALINEAYRTITHPVSRAAHDLALAEQGLSAARIGSGPLDSYLRHAATARHNNINRRHYGRILSLQLDAESQLLAGAHAWVMSQRARGPCVSVLCGNADTRRLSPRTPVRPLRQPPAPTARVFTAARQTPTCYQASQR